MSDDEPTADGPPHRGRGRRRSHGRRGHGRKRSVGIARFIEPAVLLLLREGNAHGYELADELTAFMPAQRVDVGNLYRLLRKLEDDGLVSSEWDEGEAGRAKRVYEITDEGVHALDDWAGRLRTTAADLARFLDRHEAGRDQPRPVPTRSESDRGSSPTPPESD